MLAGSLKQTLAASFLPFLPEGLETSMNTQPTGYVFNIQNFSVHDGAGIRTTVFLKGCPLRCMWCSNPESQIASPQLAFNINKCLTTEKCTRCIKACPQQAISATEDHYITINPAQCVHCHTCADHCPSSALNVYGEEKTVDEVLDEVEKESAFFARSGGGMTLSGGEAMTQPAFAIALLKGAKDRRLRTAIETCGYCHWEDLREACKYLDELIFDVKCADDALHKKGTGASNHRILTNLANVLHHYPDLPILIRTPVIPDYNDTPEQIQAIIDLLPKQKNISYELLPYHRMGQPKYEFLGMEYTLKDMKLSPSVMPALRPLEAAANASFTE